MGMLGPSGKFEESLGDATMDGTRKRRRRPGLTGPGGPAHSWSGCGLAPGQTGSHLIFEPLAKDRPHRQLGDNSTGPHRIDLGIEPHDHLQGKRKRLIDRATENHVVDLSHRPRVQPISRYFLSLGGPRFQDLPHRVVK